MIIPYICVILIFLEIILLSYPVSILYLPKPWPLSVNRMKGEVSYDKVREKKVTQELQCASWLEEFSTLQDQPRYS